ncbi:hypothetical protein VNI00_017570 [Paramarasmius palmivorus]|uniref:Uncharacterized protein n=1 Tax=Paramarasmius palmivorus TaxID=297713 RepID=A0AAW0B6J4_9AGAR
MVNPGAFSGTRLTFLTANLGAYGIAFQEGWVKDFVADLNRRYNKRYPASLPHNEEPSEEHLAAVNDEAPDPETLFPIRKSGQSDEAFEVAVREHEQLKEVTRYRGAQIARWMKYHYDKSRGIKSKDNPFTQLMAKLTGSSVAEPKRKARAYDLWAKGNPDIVEKLFEQRMKELGGAIGGEGQMDSMPSGVGDVSNDPSTAETSDQEKEDENGDEEPGENVNGKKKKKGKGKKKGRFVKKGEKAFVRVRQDVIKQEYDRLSPEDKKPWEEAVQEDWDRRVAAYKASLDAGFSRDPQARQDCISRLPSFVQPILDGITEATGMHCTLTVGGPEPADMGRLNVVSFHSGETLSTPALNFGEACQEGYRNFFIPLYGSYLRKCFTVEECKSRALPKHGVSLEAVLLGEERANFDTIETPGIPREDSAGKGGNEGVGNAEGTDPMNPITEPLPAIDVPPAIPKKSSTTSEETMRTSSAPKSPASAQLNDEVPPPMTFSPPPSPVAPSRPSSSHRGDLDPTEASSPPPCSPPITIPPSTPPRMSSPFYPPSPEDSIATADLDIPPSESLQEDGAGLQHEPELELAAGKAKVLVKKSRRSAPTVSGEALPKVTPSVSRGRATRATATSSKAPSSSAKVAGTKASIGNKRKAGKEIAPPPKRANHGKATVNSRSPDGAPAYVQNVFRMAADVGMGERFMEALQLYVRLEEDHGYQGGSLKTVDRPDEVPQWYKRRRAVWYPDLGDDLARFSQDFKSWFRACSPPWRVPKNTSLPMVRKSGADWACLRVLGPNGIVSFLVALIWWQKAIKDQSAQAPRIAELQSRFDAVFEEVMYSFQSISE